MFSGRGCALTLASAQATDCLGVLKEDSTTGSARRSSCGLHLQVLCPDATAEKLTKVVFLSWQYLGAMQRLHGGYLVNTCRGFHDSHVATSCFWFLPFCKTQSLHDFMKHQLSRPSSSLKCGRLSLVKSPSVCQCQPIHGNRSNQTRNQAGFRL